MSDKIKIRADFRSILNSHISYGQVDSTSTSTVFTATVDGITELVDGTSVMLRNGYVTSASGFTLEVNGLGAKPVYNSMADATADTTIFNINYTMLFVYDSTRITGGCWICYRGYNTNDNTIGYQIRTNNTVFTTTDKGYRYRLWLQTDEGKLMPVNTSTSTNATANRSSYMNTREFWLDGKILYNSTKADYQADVTLPSNTMWQQYNFTLGYSFNNTGKALTLTSGEPLYMVATDEGNGKGKLASPYYTQTLPSSADGKLYIYLGHMTSAVNMELALEHPIFEYKNGGIRLYRDTYTTSEVDTLLSGKSDTGHTHTGYANSTHTHTKNQITDFPTLSTVATTGSYNDLSDKPNIPQGATVDTELSSSSNNAIANSTVKSALDGKASTTHNHTKSQITDFPTIPSKTSDLNNDSGFLTSHNPIDSSLSTTSTNAVQNKVINTALSGKSDTGHTHTKSEITDFPSSMTPASHTHGNLQNNGQVGSTAQSSKNVVTDANGKITTEDKPTIPSASSTTPSADTTNGSVGTGTTWARSNHTHPKSTLYAENGHNHDSSYIAKASTDTGFVKSDGSIDGNTYLTAANASSTYVAKETGKGLFTGSYSDLTNKPSYTATVTSSTTGAYKLGSINISGSSVDIYGKDTHQSLTDYIQKSSTSGLIKNDGSIMTGGTGASNFAIGNHNHSYNDLTNKPTIPSKTSDLQNDGDGTNVFLTQHQSLTNYLQQSDVKDNLTSTDTNKPLSAKQGKELKTLVDGKANSTHSHGDLSQSIQNLSQTISGLADVATSGDYSDLINAPENLSDFNDDVGYLTSHQSLTNYVTTSDSRLSDSRTPIAHATSTTTYGVSSASNYGHAMASSTSPKANGTAAVGSETAKFARGDHVHPHSCVNTLTSTSTTTPLAANQGKVLNDNKVDKNDFNVDYVHSFVYNSNTEKYAYQSQRGAVGIGVSAIDEDDNSLLNEDGVAIIDLVFQNTNINYGSIQLVLAEANGRSYTDSNNLSNTQTIATITDTNKHHITIVVSPDTHIEEQSYDYYDLKVSNISYDDSNITISSGKTNMEEVGVYLVFNGAIGGNIEYMNVIKRTPIVNQIIDIIYPIGSTYISVNSVNPSFLFGGQWEQIEDKFLLASGSTYSAGSTGGSATVSLTESQMPRHTHIQNSHNHTQNPHTHEFPHYYSSGTETLYSSSWNSQKATTQVGAVRNATATNKEATATNKYTGGTGSSESASDGSAHENMPPYLTVYVWKRIA